MKEFNLNARCTKCGFESNSNSPSVEYTLGTFVKERQENLNLASFGEEPTEYLIRTCVRCGYKWAEKCVDAN